MARLLGLAAMAGVLALSAAEMIIPTNWTAQEAAMSSDSTLMMQISVNERMVPLAPVLVLTTGGKMDIPPTGLSGPLLLATPNNVLNAESKQVLFISCDQYTGQIQADQVFAQAWQTNVTSIVLYSRYSDWCQLTSYTEDYPWIYSLTNRTDSAKLLEETQSAGSQAVYATIGSSTMRTVNGNGTESGNNGQHNSVAGTPSTAVAMIILYSITGIISALFLVIIVTGAMRAHRHPERYGPRNVIGRPRQSRARGIARAVVDSLPLVKFGEQRTDEPKPTDVELAENASERNATADGTTKTEDQPVDGRHSIEEGIAAATTAERSNTDTANPDHLGCSICTEDFQAGEDQRVLPCDHRFHPACIDPWLLNVSGTCPLCRIDLRPPPEEAGETGEVDEHGNPILREPGAELNLTPGVAAEPLPRMGVRRSLIEGFRDIGRPTHRVQSAQARAMNRDDRLAALRVLREERMEMQRRASAEQNAEEERSTRQRLRRVFGIRTRRTGSSGEVDTEPAPEDPRAAPPGFYRGIG